MRITMLAAGTRGDVQPYVALGVGLQRAGHHVCVPAPEFFRGLVTEAGLDFRSVELKRGGLQIQSPQELLGQPELLAMMSKESGPFGTLAVLRIIQRHMADFIGAYFDVYWDSSKDADLLVASTMSFGGLDFAEKRGIVCIQAPIQPLTPTRVFPAPLLAPYGIRLNNALNRLTYYLLRLGMWRLLRAPVNRWRCEMGLSPHSGSSYWRRTQTQTSVYGFSPSVLPTPTDWPPNHHVTGYWFLDESTDWQPPADLARFLESGPPPVYVGFGSMPEDDPMRMVSVVVEALRLSGQRGILLSGWGGMGGGIPLPEGSARQILVRDQPALQRRAEAFPRSDTASLLDAERDAHGYAAFRRSDHCR